jgi:hypothetical protein
MGRWLDKVLNFLHPVISLKKEAHVSTKKIKIKVRKGSKNSGVIKAKERVDINPDKSYIKINLLIEVSFLDCLALRKFG